MTPTLGRRPPASGPPLIRSTPTIVVSSSIVAVLRLLHTGSTRLSLIYCLSVLQGLVLVRVQPMRRGGCCVVCALRPGWY